MSTSLDGKIALVTGSGRGMGRSHAVLLAERGADLVVHDVLEDELAETVALVRATGREARAIHCDIRDVAAFQGAIHDVIGELGRIDILVNNAGIGGQRAAIEDIDAEFFDRMFAIHVRGTFFATQAVVPGMKQRRAGKIVNTSSIFAMGGSAVASHYAASKSAISGLTKSWAREFGPWNINVNAVAPGFIPTDMTLGHASAAELDARAAALPLRELTQMQDISYAVAWLASSETDKITGQIVSPNSGETIVGY
jgi:3-oxoacyl-[acyl-carrier protein] reductase